MRHHDCSPIHTGASLRAAPPLVAWGSAIAGLLWLAGCGGSQSGSKPLEFTPRHAVLFDDGIDMIQDPEALQGRWLSDWQQELDERIAAADYVSAGMVKTIRVEVDPEGHTTYHLLFVVSRDLKGDAPREEVSLASREGVAGYSSLGQYRDRILNRALVAFVRNAKEADGAVVSHFHLMPPSAAITGGVDRHKQGRHERHIQVIEHHQK